MMVFLYGFACVRHFQLSFQFMHFNLSKNQIIKSSQNVDLWNVSSKIWYANLLSFSPFSAHQPLWIPDLEIIWISVFDGGISTNTHLFTPKHAELWQNVCLEIKNLAKPLEKYGEKLHIYRILYSFDFFLSWFWETKHTWIARPHHYHHVFRLPILCSRSLALAAPNAIHIRNQDVGGAFELLHQLVPILKTDIVIFNRFQ